MTVQGPFEGCELSWAMAFRTLIGKSWTKVGLVTVWWNRSLFLIILYKYSLLTWRSFFIQVECNSSFFNSKVWKFLVKSLVYMHAYFWKVEKYYKTISLFLQQNQQFSRQINVFTKNLLKVGFTENFWAWSHFIIFFYTTVLKNKKFSLTTEKKNFVKSTI